MSASIVDLMIRTVDIVAAALGLVAAMHLSLQIVLRRSFVARSTPWSLGILGAVIGLGAWSVWTRVAHLAVGSAPDSFPVAAVCLYAAGCIVYIEIRSLLSRGYSLRVLVDLLGRGGASIADLKQDYGNGLGVHGMVAKRVATLAQLGLVRMDGERVGPLTRAGRGVARLSAAMRALLRLDTVG